MMKLIIIWFLMLSYPSKNVSNDIWDKIIDKTWSDKEILAPSIVFYKTGNELPKAIMQQHGSGVYITKSKIYDITIMNDTIFLCNGLDLVTNEKQEDFFLIYEKENNTLRQNKTELKIKHDKSVIYYWIDHGKPGVKIDFKKLVDLPLGKNQIYDLLIIKEISIREN